MGDKRILFGQEPLEENADGNLQFSGRKILDNGNALFSDIQDVNIPTELTAADDGKIIEAYYANPAVYGDESDGDLAVNAPTTLSLCTDLTTDAAVGSTTITVRSTTGFVVGDEVIVITSQIYRYPDVQSLGLHEYVRIAQVLSATQLLLESPLSRDYLSDADGNKENNTKTQVVKLWNYNSITLNANLGCKSWDGYSGGVLAFRTNELTGTFNIDVSTTGFSGSGPSQHGEGYLGKKSVASGGAYGSQSNDWKSGGGHLTAGYNGGSAYGLTTNQAKTNPAMGGSGNRYFFPDDSLKFSSPGSGIVICYINNYSNFTGKIVSAPKPIGNTSEKYNAGGAIVIYSSSTAPITTDVEGTSYGAGTLRGSVGRLYVGEPDEPPTRQYQLGAKIATVIDTTLDTEIPTSKAVADYVRLPMPATDIDQAFYHVTSDDFGKILDVVYSTGDVTIMIDNDTISKYDEFIVNKLTSNTVYITSDTAVTMNDVLGGITEVVDKFGMVTIRGIASNAVQAVGNFGPVS